MIRRILSPLLGLIALNFVSAGAFAQNSIGLQFVGGGDPGTTKALAPTDKAGVPAVAQTHWIPLTGTSAPTPAPAITTDDGKTTPVAVTYKCANTWSSGLDGRTSPDNALMAGYLDTSDTNDDSSIDQVTVSGIPFAAYDVYVYVYGDTPTEHRQGVYKIGSTVEKLVDFGAFTGAYKTPTDKDPTGNYLVFKGVSGPSFTLTGAPGTSDGLARAPINAIQIVKE